MTKVVHLIAARQERELSEAEAWKRYLAVKDRAEQTRDIRDGIAAQHAWRDWLERFARIA